MIRRLENNLWVGMNITHYQGRHYLFLIDCGPTRLSIWHHLRWQDAASVIYHLEGLFSECGVPAEILIDKDSISQQALQGFSKWIGRFNCTFIVCVYPPVMALRNIIIRAWNRLQRKNNASIMEAVYWYNVTPKDNVLPLTAPANQIHCYWVWLKGINALTLDEPKQLQIGYNMSDRVWIKTQNGRCMSPYTHGGVTGVISPQNVLVDRMPCHVRDLRPVMGSNTSESESNSKLSTRIVRTIINNARSDLSELGNPDATDDTSTDKASKEEVALLWRSTRHKKPTLGCYLCEHLITEECSGIERQNKQPVTSGEPISLHRSKRQWVGYCIYRQNSGHKFGFIWLRRLTNARGHKFSNCPWLHKNRWQVSQERDEMWRQSQVGWILIVTPEEKKRRDKKWQVNLFLLSYFMDGVRLYIRHPSSSVDFYLTGMWGCMVTSLDGSSLTL